ncbi:hypothetical protein [Micromonospora profundi]
MSAAHRRPRVPPTTADTAVDKRPQVPPTTAYTAVDKRPVGRRPPQRQRD